MQRFPASWCSYRAPWGSILPAGKLAEGVEAQATQVMKNLETVLKEAGSSLQHALKATIFLTDLNDFAAVNKIYGDAFQGVYPARSCFQVSKLPGGASVEIELIAELAE